MHDNYERIQGQETVGAVLGKDSVGREISMGDLVLESIGKTVQARKIDSPSAVDRMQEIGARAVVIKDASEIDFLHTEISPKESWIPLAAVNSENNTFAVPGTDAKIEVVQNVADSSTGYAVRYKSPFHGEVMQVNILPGRPAVMHSDWPGICLVNTNAGQQLVFFEQKDFPQKPVEATFERIQTKEDILKRMSVEFPWFNEEDLGYTRIFEGVTSFEGNNNEGSAVDGKRFEQTYAKYRNYEGTGGIYGKEATDAEMIYFEARNYAKFCEMAQGLESINQVMLNTADIRQDLLNKSASERQRMAMETLAEIEGEMVSLLGARWEVENQLFVKPPTDPYKKYVTRVASNATVEDFRRIAGLYFHGTAVVMDNIEALTAQLNPNGDKGFNRSYVIKRIADIEAHEIGHDKTQGVWAFSLKMGQPGFRGTTLREVPANENSWKYEEAWNEWKSVTFPRELIAGRDPATRMYRGAFARAYNHNSYYYRVKYNTESGAPSISSERGGALELNTMIYEMLDLAQPGGSIQLESHGKKFNVDGAFVYKCALATAHLRQDRGVITIAGESEDLLGFGDLYDAYITAYNRYSGIRKETYTERLSGSTDSDYYAQVSYVAENSRATVNLSKSTGLLMDGFTPDRVAREIYAKVNRLANAV